MRVTGRDEGWGQQGHSGLSKKGWLGKAKEPLQIAAFISGPNPQAVFLRGLRSSGKEKSDFFFFKITF